MTTLSDKTRKGKSKTSKQSKPTTETPPATPGAARHAQFDAIRAILKATGDLPAVAGEGGGQ